VSRDTIFTVMAQPGLSWNTMFRKLRNLSWSMNEKKKCNENKVLLKLSVPYILPNIEDRKPYKNNI